MNERQLFALLWAARAIVVSDFTPEEQVHLASAAAKLEAQQTDTLNIDEYRVLGDAALCAGTLLTASFAGIDCGTLPDPAPEIVDIDAAQAFCDAHGRQEAAIA